MDLPILANDLARLTDKDRGVEPTFPLAARVQFRIAETKTLSQSPGFIEKGLDLWARHSFLIERADLRFVIQGPPRKKRRKRKFGKDHQIAVCIRRVAQMRAQPLNDMGPGLVAGDRAHLSCRDVQETLRGHSEPPLLCGAGVERPLRLLTGRTLSQLFP